MPSAIPLPLCLMLVYGTVWRHLGVGMYEYRRCSFFPLLHIARWLLVLEGCTMLKEMRVICITWHLEKYFKTPISVIHFGLCPITQRLKLESGSHTKKLQTTWKLLLLILNFFCWFKFEIQPFFAGSHLSRFFSQINLPISSYQNVKTLKWAKKYS